MDPVRLRAAGGEGERQNPAAASRAVTRAEMMTPDHQVRAALQRFKPSPHQQAARRADIENALAMMAAAITVQNLVKAYRSKAHRRAMRAYHRALLKVRTTYHAASFGQQFAAVESAIAEIENPGPPLVLSLYPRAAGRWRQAYAVALAHWLLTKWEGNAALTRKGDWWWLAAILYGRRQPLDLFRHMRAFKLELSPLRDLY